LSVTVNVTVYVPALAYVLPGLTPEAMLPSPNVHAYAAMLPSLSEDPPPLKLQTRFVHAKENEAMGGVFVGTSPPENRLWSSLLGEPVPAPTTIPVVVFARIACFTEAALAPPLPGMDR
jgi:hypothetical protein